MRGGILRMGFVPFKGGQRSSIKLYAFRNGFGLYPSGYVIKIVSSSCARPSPTAACRGNAQRQAVFGHGAAGETQPLRHGRVVQRRCEGSQLPDLPVELIHAAAMVGLAEKAAQGSGSSARMRAKLRSTAS